MRNLSHDSCASTFRAVERMSIACLIVSSNVHAAPSSLPVEFPDEVIMDAQQLAGDALSGAGADLASIWQQVESVEQLSGAAGHFDKTLASVTAPGEGGNSTDGYIVTIYPQAIVKLYPDLAPMAESEGGHAAAGVIASLLILELGHVCLGHSQEQTTNGQNAYFSCAHLALDLAQKQLTCCLVECNGGKLYEFCEEGNGKKKDELFATLIGLCRETRRLVEKWNTDKDDEMQATLDGPETADRCFEDPESVAPWSGSEIPHAACDWIPKPAGPEEEAPTTEDDGKTPPMAPCKPCEDLLDFLESEDFGDDPDLVEFCEEQLQEREGGGE